MPPQLQSVFVRLREVLEKHADRFRIGRTTEAHFSLDAPPGPATLRAWGGKSRNRMIPVAWVQLGKSYVSYHLMGIGGNPKLLEGCSAGLRARMQGKACFNFTKVDEKLVEELSDLTTRSLEGMRKAEYIG